LLVVFAFVAGAGTALSPCVLPVLPALLSAGATGGRRRPLGIALGLAATFTITIVGLATVVKGVGLGDSATRDLAIVALAVFGVALVVPRIGDRIEAPLSRLSRFGPRSGGRGFWSGLLVGGALGFLYAPCAGPILAAVVSVSAASGRTVAVGLAFSLGSAVVLLVLALAGRAIADRIRRAGRGPGLQRTLGAVMLVTAVAMAFQFDVRFQTAIANHLPAAVIDPTQSLETSHAVSKRLADLRPPSRFARAAAQAGPKLPDYGPAPDFTGTQRWFNSKPLSLAQLRGRVVLVDFWTYTCINCIRTLPHLVAWDKKYRHDGLTIVGVHSPEFSFEHDAANVARAIKQNGIRYPVVQDNNLATWSAWSNEYWPADYLIDAQGHVRAAHFGEGDYGVIERQIRQLLTTAGARDLGGDSHPSKTYDPTNEATPETYLGLDRAERFLPGAALRGTRVYNRYRGKLPLSHFSFAGLWSVTGESATAGAGAQLYGNVAGKDVYLVLSPPPGHAGSVRVTVDGRPEKVIHVTTQRLYHLLSRPKPGEYQLRLDFSRGVAGYAFTFG
jgi:cytochrome c biogenesis protein CcdA/thiol-disulfide isomerase/thioredoxin